MESRSQLVFYARPLQDASLPSSSLFPDRRTCCERNSTVQDCRYRDPTSYLAVTYFDVIEQDLQTIGGRVYMTRATIAGKEYTLVIDTGSSDTWIASSQFQCVTQFTQSPLPQSDCGFGPLHNESLSKSWDAYEGYNFSVRYTDGEFLEGELGVENVEIGGVKFERVIGVVERGWWLGDQESSGLLGFAYPGIASNVEALNYTSVLFTLFDTATTLPPIFSLALTRPTPSSPRGGGLLALGGIPDIPHDPSFATVDILPSPYGPYTFYTIPLQTFTIIPPSTSSLPPRGVTLNYTRAIPTIIDSGSTLMYLPSAVADRVAAAFVPPARFDSQMGLYVVACGAQVPRVGVGVGGKVFWVDARDLVSNETVDGGRTDRGECVVAVQRMGGGDAILGDAWLKSVLVVFDLEEGRVRVAGRWE
ncbi:acid protease [Sporormia fimetaria CBS 119925]|uniref:Acid protease n=1 Tax=Sporormia fimetaria CBS 119925 TaxID=1340428 RepID=A0A6A6V4U9_9PLEO|nr:acid protease [Sporormia fimetaria CBS 119925]